MKKKTVVMSITSVAKAAGVSIATVSRVLNDPHLVNPGTVRRVEEAMRTLNYRVAPTAERRGRKADARGRLRHKTVAFLWTGGRSSATSLTGMDMLQGASAALRKHRVNLIADYVDADGKLPAAVVAGAVDGVLLHGPEPSPEVTQKLRGLPAVWLLSPGASQWGDRVRPDHQKLGVDALDFLADRGCKNIVCVTYADRLGSFFAMRSAGFAYRAEQRGITCRFLGRNFAEVPDAAARFRLAAQIAEEFEQLSPRSDALFVANELGGYLHEQLVRRGIKPMTDFLMIAGDRDFAPQHLEPEPIMVTVHGVDIGRLAVDLLLWRLENPDVRQVAQLIASSLIEPKKRD
jgi:LacI family transcriptional regulator